MIFKIKVIKMDPEIIPMNLSETMSVARTLNLLPAVNQLVWERLLQLGFYEGNPNLSIPPENKYTRSKILSMKRDTDSFVESLGLLPQIKQLLIDTKNSSSGFIRMFGETARKDDFKPGIVITPEHGNLIYDSESYRAVSTIVFYVDSEGKIKLKNISDSAGYGLIPIEVSDRIENPVDFYKDASYLNFDHGIDRIYFSPTHPIALEFNGGAPIPDDEQFLWSYSNDDYSIELKD